MASKKPNKTTSSTTSNKPKTIKKTSWECENQCPLPEMCLAGKRYVAGLIPGREAKGCVCKFSK